MQSLHLFCCLGASVSEHIRHRSEVRRKETEPESWHELGIDRQGPRQIVRSKSDLPSEELQEERRSGTLTVGLGRTGTL